MAIPKRTSAESICHANGLYHRGIYCPAALWEQVVHAQTPESADEVLDSLPVETQRQLRAVYDNRPSLPRDAEFADAVAALVAWLERGRASL